jgi:hypothetical protein
MKMYSGCFLLASIFFFLIPWNAFAGWQVAKKNMNPPREPFFQTDRPPKKVTTASRGFYPSAPIVTAPVAVAPVVVAPVPPPPPPAACNVRLPPAAYIPNGYRTNVYPRPTSNISIGMPVYAVSISGSLKENVERIMGRYHWKVIWKAPYDFNFDGRVTGSSLPAVIRKLFQPFPLQARMYMSNRTLAVVPRFKPTGPA